MRGGYLGGIAAWTGFTLPSAIILVLFAYGATALSGPIGAGLLHGLKLVAVAIVAQAVGGMARTLCPDRERVSIAVVAALIILFSTSSVAQIGAIAVGGLAGLCLCRGATPPPDDHMVLPISRGVGLAALIPLERAQHGRGGGRLLQQCPADLACARAQAALGRDVQDLAR
jgi:chromate transporter